MDRKTLEDLGFTKEQIDNVLDRLHEEIDGAKQELNNQIELNKKLEDDLRQKETDLKSISEQSKTFEETQSALSELQKKYESQSLEHQNKLDSIEFDNLLNSNISTFKGKNAKAIKALIDIDNLKTSKNRADDIKKSIESLVQSEDSSFLFGEAVAKPVSSTNLIGSTQAAPAAEKREIPTFF